MDNPMEQPFSFTEAQMKFELTLSLGADACGWSTSHQLLERPETDTIKALLAEAVETFIALYDTEPIRYASSIRQIAEEIEVPLTR